MTVYRSLVLAGATCALVAATLPAQADKLSVVASFSILGDMVGRVGGDRVEVTTLVGPNSDAHVFTPTPKVVATLSKTSVFFVNGLGFEGWLERLVESSGSKATVVVASAGVKTLKAAAGHRDEHEDGDHGDEKAAESKDHDHDHADADGDHQDDHDAGEHAKEADAHDHGEIDPHAWQSAANAVIYVGNIEKALCAADPAGCDSFAANSKTYVAELTALHKDIEQQFAAVQADRRKAVTSHDAFGYFADAYGIAFLAPEGVSTESEATAADVANLIKQIRDDGISAVFVENVSDKRLIEQIGKDTGAVVGGTLYSDALSAADGPAATYIDMMRHNAKTIAEALQAAS